MSELNLSSFIWSVADLLRGDYKQSEYGKVILPFTVLRRLDCVLEPAKAAVLAVTLQCAAQGDTATLAQTVGETLENLNAVSRDEQASGALTEEPLEELVADKSYHSNDTLVHAQGIGTRTYFAEQDRGRRVWAGDAEARRAVYANRRRIRGARGKRLMRQRGELLERPFAHALETGGLRRVFVRGRERIWKRLLIHVAGLNLRLLMWKVFGVGTPRGLQGHGKALVFAIINVWRFDTPDTRTPQPQTLWRPMPSFATPRAECTAAA